MDRNDRNDRNDRSKAKDAREGHEKDADRQRRAKVAADADDRSMEPNPPRTTTGHITSPKFGSAGSGGAELEPGPERD